MKREIKIGLTVVSAIVIIYVVFAWMRNLHWFDDGYKKYTVVFDNVNGLLLGASVNVFGFTAGRVLDIQPTQENVRVTISLSDKIVLHSDAIAEIQLKELMGGKQIEIRPGKNTKILSDGGVFTGYASPDLTSAFSTFGETMKQIDTTRIRVMLENMEKITTTLAEFSGQFKGKNIDVMTGELISTAVELRHTSVGVNQLLAEVQRRNVINKGDSAFRAVGMMLQNVETMLQSSDKTLQASAGLMNQVKGLIERAENKVLPKTDSIMQNVLVMLSKTDETLQTVGGIINKLKEDETVIGKVLNDPEFLHKLDSTINNVNQTLEFVRNQKIKVSFGLKNARPKNPPPQ